MTSGILKLALFIHDSNSLKEKRLAGIVNFIEELKTTDLINYEMELI